MTNGRATHVLHTEITNRDHKIISEITNQCGMLKTLLLMLIEKIVRKKKTEKTRATLSSLEMDVLVNHWKENFDELDTKTRNETSTKTVSAVSILGTNKTLKNCK